LKNPKLSGEEWNVLANQLSTEGWLTDSYNPKNGKRRWTPTKWGERHYQKTCKLVGVDKLFGGATLKQLEDANLGYETLGDSHLYNLNLLVDILDTKFQGKKELTRIGYEWIYAYTKLKGKKLNKYQAKNQITRSFEAILGMIFVAFYLLSQSLVMRLEKKKGGKK
tara:strand:+ start:308 stop:805 length:498 start_codon:yes stop_codon:yes gene_type:complete